MTVVESPPRVRKRRAVRQDRILTIAARSFARNGPEAVSLDEIAEQVDVAKGTLYSHFPTKEALLVAIVEPALQSLDRTLGAIVPGDARGVVTALLRQWAALLREHHDAMRVAHCLETELPEPLVVVHRRVVAKVLRLLSRSDVQAKLRGSPQWASLLIARLALPLFDTYEIIDPTGESFVETTSHLLLRPEPRTTRPITTKAKAPTRR
jgi:AcrR family transcriptional regulator